MKLWKLVSKKRSLNKERYWESSYTPTPLFATTTIAGCCFEYSSTPDNIKLCQNHN